MALSNADNCARLLTALILYIEIIPLKILCVNIGKEGMSKKKAVKGNVSSDFSTAVIPHYYSIFKIHYDKFRIFRNAVSGHRLVGKILL